MAAVTCNRKVIKLSLNKCMLIQAWESGSKRDRETATKEIDKLRGTIQTLTRTTNPLGKLLDYVQVIHIYSHTVLHDWCLFFIQN